MAKFQRASGSGLLLMELIFSLLFFALAGAICVGLFARSHVLSQQAQQQNTATALCSSVLEIVKAADSLEEAQAAVSRFLPQGSWAGESFTDGPLRLQLTEAHGRLLADCRYQSSHIDYQLTLHHYLEGGQP